jgi:SMODS and SLOG-associating 2TM effector domain 1/Protein of unknown function (DUF4231)
VTDSIIQALWDEHVGWSQTAGRLKSRLTLWRSVVLALTVVGAALQTLAATVEISPIRVGAGAAGTVALGLVPFLTRYFLTAEDTGKWLRARSVSEGIKSEIFAYLASAEPYSGPDALDTLRKKTRDIREWGRNLELERAKVASPTAPAPPILDADAYLRSRVYQQVNEYYRPKAKQNADRAEQFRRVEIAFAGLAAVLSAIATFLGDPMSAQLGPWVAVLTTIGGSIAAHAAASHYDFQATTFFATARQLEDLAQDWQATGKSAPSKEWSELVHACEEAISATNRAWMAKLDEQR